ncbi:MAG: branched-chain amino acid ABC transporter substrate-binding protein [Ardenticatenia bacterium]|nr:MAG: branched-chain amino acid ABC transporter substrate-binding protein [Ardenticatenia bacterium]
MNTRKLLSLLSLLFVLLALAACGGGQSGEESTGESGGEQAATTEGKVVRVYTSWPLQGPMLPEGQSMKRAADLALKHYLDAHGGEGPGGYTVEIVNLDDASPTTGSWDGTIEAENAQKCVNDPLCMVYFATYNSGAAKVSIPITNKAGIAQITPANTYPGLTKPWAEGEPDIYYPADNRPTYFRTNATDDLQGYSAASWAKCLGFKKVYILDDRQLYGKGVADAFEQQAKKIGLEIVGRDGVESTDIDFRALLAKVKDAQPDLVYGGFVIDSGGPQIIQQMATLGLFDQGVKFMGPDGLVNPALAEQAGGAQVVDGNVLLTFPGLAPNLLETESGKKFYNDFIAEYGEEPSPWSTYAYQAMQVILDSIERAAASGEVTRASVLDAMRNTKDFEGITGVFSFDENGDTTLVQMASYSVENGEFKFEGAISPEMADSCP